jgi:hypothetical protein
MTLAALLEYPLRAMPFTSQGAQKKWLPRAIFSFRFWGLEVPEAAHAAFV